MGSSLLYGKARTQAGAALALAWALGAAACGQAGSGGGDAAKAGDAAPGGGSSGAAAGGGTPGTAPLVTALGAPASPEVQALFEGDFEAVGAEPFWTMELFSDAASFKRPGLDDVLAVTGPRAYRALGMQVEGGALTITLKAGACVHTSGETYPYLASVFYEGVSYEGCARRASGTGATPAWSALLPELLPMVDACLARAPAKPARVTIAYVMETGQSVARLLASDGGRYECAVNGETGEIEDFAPIGDRDVIQGERDPMFSRSPQEPPAGSCWSNEPALSPTGEQMGWLSRRTC